ncbi:MAG: ParB/RepB/Spo0J family partition protein [Candidatus Omnitrophota bacterium]
MERKVLGKGLGALIAPEAERKEAAGVQNLNPQQIIPNRYQPRLKFNEEKFQELVDSIKEKGIVQPVVVRKNNETEYELIAGERRLRAIKALNLKEIPAIIKNVNNQEMLELSIIENIQRDDLNPLEEAKAYETLVNDFNFTQEQIAKSVGKSRATVANMLRLLTLPKKVKDALFNEQISFGHAKAILAQASAEYQLALLDKIITKKLSVREAEQTAFKSTKIKTKKQSSKDENVQRLEEELRLTFGTKVSVVHGTKRGKIQIEYYSLDDLERILKVIRKQ